MIKYVVILLFIILGVFLLIAYLNTYTNLKDVKNKMDNSFSKINELVSRKYELMTSLYECIKKHFNKKNYLKEFNLLDISILSLYELDEELNKHFSTMKAVKEDNKKLNTKEINKLIEEILSIDHDLVAAKKYYNKNNNSLIKLIKGYYKIVSNISGIKPCTSFEIKKSK